MSGVAHDINNPLYVIIGLAENILEETDLASIRDQVREIAEAAKRIGTICRDLTQYSRLSASYDLSEVELNTHLDEALKIARHATIPKDLSVVKNYTADLVVRAKGEEILQIFVNLMINAIHAMDGNGRLSLTSQCKDGTGSVAIADTGCGISKESLDRIFDPFYTTKPPGKGTGLGLHTVKSIVQKYHGQLFVESEIGKGTTFRIEFPMATHS